ncbi:hypothetical protein BC829DRAFT_400856 [Chytridium lagenaria]|nr:hypothetical protein BC829DRAFT_400856 [Chytridium lagenaria]
MPKDIIPLHIHCRDDDMIPVSPALSIYNLVVSSSLSFFFVDSPSITLSVPFLVVIISSFSSFPSLIHIIIISHLSLL